VQAVDQAPQPPAHAPAPIKGYPATLAAGKRTTGLLWRGTAASAMLAAPPRAYGRPTCGAPHATAGACRDGAGPRACGPLITGLPCLLACSPGQHRTPPWATTWKPNRGGRPCFAWHGPPPSKPYRCRSDRRPRHSLGVAMGHGRRNSTARMALHGRATASALPLLHDPRKKRSCNKHGCTRATGITPSFQGCYR
jgi:hypothetical protein